MASMMGPMCWSAVPGLTMAKVRSTGNGVLNHQCKEALADSAVKGAYTQPGPKVVDKVPAMPSKPVARANPSIAPMPSKANAVQLPTAAARNGDPSGNNCAASPLLTVRDTDPITTKPLLRRSASMASTLASAEGITTAQVRCRVAASVVGKKKLASLVADQVESLPWQAFCCPSVPNKARSVH